MKISRQQLSRLSYLVTLAILTISVSLRGEPIRISGSDFLAGPLDQVLISLAEERSEEIKVSWPGSYLVKQALQQQQIDMALLALPEGPASLMEEHTGWAELPFAYRIALLVVNQENPLQSMTLKALRGIYGIEGADSLNHWDSFGLRGVWRSRMISAHILDIPGAFTPALFRRYCLEGVSLKKRVQSWQETAALLKYVANNPTAIAVLPALPDLPEQPKIRVLAIVDTSKQLPFTPKPNNIYTGDYPLRLPFFILYNRERSATLKPYLKRLLADDVAERLATHYFVPLPEMLRYDLTLQFF